MNQAKSVRRRYAGIGTIIVLSFGLCVMLVAVLWSYVVPAGPPSQGPWIDAGSTSDLPPGTSRILQVNSQRVLVINTGEGVIALDAICPHLGAPLVWNAK